MQSLTAYEKLQLQTMYPNVPNYLNGRGFSDLFFCPQHSPFNTSRNHEYHHDIPYFQEKNEQSHCEHERFTRLHHSPSLPFDFSNLNRIIRENTSMEFLTPPASASCSRSTLHGGATSAPPFYPNSCSSPVPSSDGLPSSGFGSLTDQHFRQGQQECFKGAITLQNGEVVYGPANVFTADCVHDLVKKQRDSDAKRIVSNKVFVGGISHSMNRETINSFFAQFGNVFVDWPVKGPRTNVRGKTIPMSSYSYLFLVYHEEKSVHRLMNACQNPAENEFYVRVPGCGGAPIQIRPWYIRNAFYVSSKAFTAEIIDIHRTVFVGGLPRIVTAREMAQMFSEFGKVLLVTIDIDQDYGYPKGAARVTFERDSSFNKALEKKYLKFDNIDSSKTTIEIKPYVMEDVACDQCGGLWFNPFLDVYEHLKASLNEPEQEQMTLHNAAVPEQSPFFGSNVWSPTTKNINSFDIWKPHNHPNSENYPLKSSENQQNHLLNCFDHEQNEKHDALAGAKKFLEMTKKFGLDEEKTENVGGVEYPIGPALWNLFIPPPSFYADYEPVQYRVEQQIENYLQLKRASVYSNKSSYCKEKPCRQYYCPSCSNKLHSGPNQHVLMPAGKPERRPRKDKNMYLVRQQQ